MMDTHTIKSSAWHAQEIDAVFAAVSSDVEGLNTGEVNVRLQKYGLNTLPPPQKKPPILIFLSHFQVRPG